MNQGRTIFIISILLLFGCTIIIFIFLFNNKYMDGNNYIDDISKFNKTRIDTIFSVRTPQDIAQVICLAKKNNIKVSICGEQHSMGGQTITRNGYLIDTKSFNRVIRFDPVNYLVIVEPGITWAQLIYFLNKYGFSPKILQSYASFSIGGSVSINIHGITCDEPLCDSVVELEIINADCKSITCNRKINSELFSLVIGGYGLFGIITNITLRVIRNTKLVMRSIMTNATDFQKIYSELLTQDVAVKMGRINVT